MQYKEDKWKDKHESEVFNLPNWGNMTAVFFTNKIMTFVWNCNIGGP